MDYCFIIACCLSTQALQSSAHLDSFLVRENERYSSPDTAFCLLDTVSQRLFTQLLMAH